ncbi:hypothetical protein FRB95_000819 [Tulasnella sp. JGI-2019a]|nr:hypothetical protein FRB95_000819 [Tulasnella sp. JGI-2019a]
MSCHLRCSRVPHANKAIAVSIEALPKRGAWSFIRTSTPYNGVTDSPRLSLPLDVRRRRFALTPLLISHLESALREPPSQHPCLYHPGRAIVISTYRMQFASGSTNQHITRRDVRCSRAPSL